MGFDSIREQAEGLLQAAQGLTSPIRELPEGQWTADVELSADQQQEARDLGMVQLDGSVQAALFLTKRAVAPEDLDSIEPEPDEQDHAIVSMVLTAAAGAKLNHEQVIAAGAGVTLGAEAAGRLAFGHHRRYSQSITGLDALHDYLGHLRIPYAVEALRELGEGELFAVELSGSGQLAASAGWQTGLVRSFKGTELERLIPGDLGEVAAGITAAVTVTARVEGEMRVLIDPSPRKPDRVRVRLYRKHGNFVGAGLRLAAEVKLTQAEDFVEAAFSRLLQLPDGLVAKVEKLEVRFKELQTKLNKLSREVRDEIAVATDVAAAALGLDDLQRLGANLQGTPELAEPLAPFLDGLTEVQAILDDAEEEIQQFVADAFRRAGAPLDRLAAEVDSWLNGYRKARQRAVDFVIERAKEGVSAELTAGINRARTSEVLLELEFELETAGLLCIEAMKGNFAPGIERALTPGATGVEIIGGSLKSSTKTERFYNLRLNLFGFRASVDFRRFDEVEVETDPRTGVMSIRGQAGASLTATTNRQISELSFLFDVYGAFERQGETFLTSPATSFKASLTRSAEFSEASRIRPLIERHLAGARQLRLIDEERQQELSEALLGNPSPTYSYDLGLGFPASTIFRMFGLDLPGKDSEIRSQVWAWMRQAAAVLDVPIAHPRGDVPLSATFIDSTIEAVRLDPILAPGGRAPDAIRALRFENRYFTEGAQRQIFFYLRNAHFFVEAYLRTRRHLSEGDTLKRATKTLSGIAAKTVSGVGAIDIQPFNAKYLVFAFAEGLREVDITMTFRRGSVNVPI